ncbi:MAG: AAA family ATPase, partial [Alphaproteobacteria bacterium]|nr:AAA family ATPase [Alphaproteobacteria bacterium]
MTGFKSFAEGAEVEIDSGLTGIVGPNGCGKSNIVEGLRWVMGESNARQMRGAEMDDVIFSGTDKRPARNLAEITLHLDNSDRTAPSEFNGDDEIEITRKIERGKGSNYYVNARPARAKDVQLLFADSATGARSSGIVSQGRIGAIIGARPVDRRALLEEAANIRGLHARRHEAELRLRAAETNLERLDDVVAGLVEQRDSLRKQARQAARYRSVADRIRKAEAQLLLARWTNAEATLAESDDALRAARSLAAERTEAAAACATARTERAAALPELRETEVARAAEYQRLAIGRDELDREEARVRDAIERVIARQTQMREDIAREESLRSDAADAMERLQVEAAQLQQQIDEAAPHREAAITALAGAREQANAADAALADAAGKVRAAASTRQALANRTTDLERRIASAEQNLADISLDQLDAAASEAATALTGAEVNAEQAATALATAETALTDSQTAFDTAMATQREAATQSARLQAEIDALGYLLEGPGGNDDTPILDSLTVGDGMEKALTSYLSDELSAPAGTGETAYWRGGSDAAGLAPPGGSRPLAAHITGAKELSAALAGVGIVDSAAEAQVMQAELKPGQALTTPEGGLWRWDGFVRRSTAQDPGAERIRQRQRLETLQGELVEAGAAEAGLAETADAASVTLGGAREAIAECRAASNISGAALSDARRTDESCRLRLTSSRERAEELQATLETMRADLATATIEAEGLGDDAALAEAEAAARALSETARTQLAEAMQAESRLAETLRAAGDRKTACAGETAQWQDRRSGAESRVTEMKSRLAEAEAEQERLSARPDEIAAQRHELADS